MRSILEIPEVSTEHLPEVKSLVNQLGLLLEENKYAQGADGQVVFEEPEIDQEARSALMRLNVLTGKTHGMLKFAFFWENTSLDDMAMSLLLPKSPAVHDVTVEEICEIVEMIDSGCLEDYLLTYYMDLLKNSLILEHVSDYIFNPQMYGLPEDACARDRAVKMKSDGFKL